MKKKPTFYITLLLLALITRTHFLIKLFLQHLLPQSDMSLQAFPQLYSPMAQLQEALLSIFLEATLVPTLPQSQFFSGAILAI